VLTPTSWSAASVTVHHAILSGTPTPETVAARYVEER